MSRLEKHLEVRNALSKYLQKIDDVKDVLEYGQKHPEKVIKEDLLLYLTDLTELSNSTFKTIDALLELTSDLHKKTRIRN